MNTEDMILKLDVALMGLENKSAMMNIYSELEAIREVKTALQDMEEPTITAAFTEEREMLEAEYEKIPEEICDDIQSTDLLRIRDAYRYMSKRRLDYYCPSLSFCETWIDRVASYPEPGNDSQEYNNWACAAGVNDGEDFVYELQMFAWVEYYKIFRDSERIKKIKEEAGKT